MNVVIVSNFLNQHMLPICEAFLKYDKVNCFKFVAVMEQSVERKELGFVDINKQHEFVICAYANKTQLEKAYMATENADIAIIADAPTEYVNIRMKSDKLTYICSERYYKKGLWRIFNPITYNYIYNRLLKYKNKENLFYLTIGTYAPFDLHLLGFPLNKCFHWAYFPLIHNGFKEKLEQKSESPKPLKILWVGRMLDVKHPEVAIRVANNLKKIGVKFELIMVGSGKKSESIMSLIEKKKLQDVVKYKGVCSPATVQEFMATSDVYLFTSDYWEGWGAVLNEAMANGCIPIASNKAGATNVLIKNGQNGFIYNSEKEIVNFILKISSDESVRKMGSASQRTIEEIWSSEVAVSRLIEVSYAILESNKIPVYENCTPMSAPELKKARNYFNSNI